MKISFIVNAVITGQIYANPFYFFLRSFLDFKYPTNKVEWVGKIFTYESIEEAVDRALINEPDVLLLSVFIYNMGEIDAIVEEVRARNSKVKIILGGPNVNGRQVQDNFITWPNIDAVVYGDGEEAFLELVKRWELTSELSAGLNCGIPGDDGFYKRFRWEEHDSYPTYAGIMFDEWQTAHEEISTRYADGGYGRVGVIWPAETNRGCPYGCSFCDWSAGLHHKVTIKPMKAVKQDINAFTKIDNAVMFLNDANFFQIKRDEQILEYMNEKRIKYKVTSWSKLKKDKVYEYFIKNSDRVQEMVDEGYLAGQPGIGRVALQSIKKETLDAIHRPEIPWSDHKKLIQEYKETRHHEITISAELINDLPLMTDYDYIWQYLELYEAGIEMVSFNNWEYLPNAPVNEDNYLNKWNLKKIKTLNIGMWGEVEVTEDRNSILDNLKPNNHYWSNGVVGELGVPNTIGHLFGKLYNYCFEHKRDFKQELSKHIDTLLTLNEMWINQLISRKLSDGTIVFGFYSKTEKKYYHYAAWLENMYGRILFSKSKPRPINNPQYEEIHKLLQKHILYHKIPEAILQKKVA
jgi:hypothetical protein